MEKENFIKLLQRSSPNDIREFLIKKGKTKLISPFIFLDDTEGYEDKDKQKCNSSKRSHE